MSQDPNHNYNDGSYSAACDFTSKAPLGRRDQLAASLARARTLRKLGRHSCATALLAQRSAQFKEAAQ
jgi:hypothetical protein